jgi:hypothetical protein
VDFDVLGTASSDAGSGELAGGRNTDCGQDEACYAKLASTLGVSYLVAVRVEEQSRNYEITLELMSGRTGGIVATNRERCEICGLEEAGEKMTLAAATLRSRLEALTRAPARFVFRTRPAGAHVSIDGRPVGRTPFDTTLPAGQHHLSITLEGYSPLERTLTVVSGVDESMNLDLVRQPTRFPFKTAGWVAIVSGAALVAAGGWLVVKNGQEVPCPEERKDLEGDCPEIWSTSIGGAALAGLGMASMTLGGVWLYLGSPTGGAVGQTERAFRPRLVLAVRGAF